MTLASDNTYQGEQQQGADGLHHVNWGNAMVSTHRGHHRQY